ncbi:MULTISPECIES: amino acid permease [unclassified Sphingomonas]|uniref:amino acid permease n=1 Tax=unclassified Sphingomonas TaxID=196159 RepID=UPI0006F490E1|nr:MULTISPECIES: amino acid permease [unclassified Sphingomonas]KRB94612.1 amino acid permease [Sphingomonas sp. Root720]
MEKEQGPDGLDRTLGPISIIALGVGGIIGAGAFVLTGVAAASFAGPGISLSFVIAGMACLLAGLCYAEYAAMLPVAGSAYSYVTFTMGRFAGWLVGWILILDYLVVCSLIAVGWSAYTGAFLSGAGHPLPARWSAPPIAYDAATGFGLSGAVINLPAMLLILLVATVLTGGLRKSVAFNWVVAGLKVGAIALFVLFGAAQVDLSNWQPFIPPNDGSFGSFGWSGVVRGAAVVFVAFLGFDAVSTTAQEAKNPQRTMPVAILGALGVVTLTYVALSLVMTGLSPYRELGVANPLNVALVHGGPSLAWLRPVLSVTTIIGLASGVMVVMLGQSRIFLAMSRDRLLPALFGEIDPKTRTPVKGVKLIAAIAIALAGLFPVHLLGEIIAIGTLLAFAIVCVGIVVLRRVRPDLPRPFRTPLSPLVPLAGALWCGVLMTFLPGVTWIAFLLWLGAGVAVYFAYSRPRAMRGGT